MRIPSYVVAAAVALLLVSPAQSLAQFATLSLDNPHQTTAAPAVGSLTLDFTGKVTITFGAQGVAVADPAINATDTFTLLATLDPDFVAFLPQSGTYTGRLFTVEVPAATPQDYYGFNFVNEPSELEVQGITPAGSRTIVTAPFSVTVVVPEPSTAGLLVLGCLGCRLLHRRPSHR